MIKKFSGIAFLLLSGCAVSAPKDEAVSRVSVSFVDPEKFTDSRRAELAVELDFHFYRVICAGNAV